MALFLPKRSAKEKKKSKSRKFLDQEIHFCSAHQTININFYQWKNNLKLN
jgi:hypothetical protein